MRSAYSWVRSVVCTSFHVPRISDRTAPVRRKRLPPRTMPRLNYALHMQDVTKVAIKCLAICSGRRGCKVSTKAAVLQGGPSQPFRSLNARIGMSLSGPQGRCASIASHLRKAGSGQWPCLNSKLSYSGLLPRCIQLGLNRTNTSPTRQRGEGRRRSPRWRDLMLRYLTPGTRKTAEFPGFPRPFASEDSRFLCVRKDQRNKALRC